MAKTAFLVLSFSLIFISACGSISTRPDVEQTPSVEKKSFKKLEKQEPNSSNGIDKTIASLLNKAGEQERTGKLETAIVTIERALRIQPQNAYLWFYLADLYFKKGDYEKSIQFARRSDSFSASDSEQRELNAQLIARAKQASTDFK